METGTGSAFTSFGKIAKAGLALACAPLLFAACAHAGEPAVAAPSNQSWRLAQSQALMSPANPAAPYHFQQIHKLFPARVLQPAVTPSPLPPSEKKIEIASFAYSFDSAEKSATDYLATRKVTGLMMVRQGKVAFETYRYGATDKSTMIAFSTTKSIVSLLIGKLIEQGRLKSIDLLVTQLLPELAGSGYEGATVRHVLQMTTALEFPGEDKGAAGEGRDIRGAANRNFSMNDGGMRAQPALARPRTDRTHGQRWEYINTNTQVLALLVEKLSGMSVSAYAEKYLWQPIGAEAPAYWLVDNADIDKSFEHGWMGFNATVRDFSRVGLMMLNNGNWNGQQIIPADWVRASTTADNDAVRTLPGRGTMNYGLQWWMPADSTSEFMSIGFAGQIIYVNRAKDVVIVQTAADVGHSGASTTETVAFFRALAQS